MHTVNLGCGLFTNGGGLFELLKIAWFPGDTEAQRWRAADQSFRSFLRKHKIVCSQPALKSWMLVLRGEEYCYFATKASSFESKLAGWFALYCCATCLSAVSHYFLTVGAAGGAAGAGVVVVLAAAAVVASFAEAYNSRVITSWLAEETNKAALQFPGNPRISLTANCVWHLHSWYSQLEQYGRYLSQAVPAVCLAHVFWGIVGKARDVGCRFTNITV